MTPATLPYRRPPTKSHRGAKEADMQPRGPEVLPLIGTVALTLRTPTADAQDLASTCEPFSDLLSSADWGAS